VQIQEIPVENQAPPTLSVRTPAQLGNLVREQRKKRRLRQDAVASLSNVSTGFLSDFENGKPTAEIGKILQVLATLGLEVLVSPRIAPATRQKARP